MRRILRATTLSLVRKSPPTESAGIAFQKPRQPSRVLPGPRPGPSGQRFAVIRKNVQTGVETQVGFPAGSRNLADQQVVFNNVRTSRQGLSLRDIFFVQEVSV